MTKKQRSFLFFLMVFLFIIAGPSIVFYSQGYRLDLQNKQIVKTGAFYFRVTPRSVQIEVSSTDNERLKSASTDFIFGTAYVENLIPKNYKVKISKNDYHDWSKELEINEGMATEIKNITLITKSPNFRVLKENVEDFFYFPENNLYIAKIINETEWSLLKYNQSGLYFSEIISFDLENELIDIINLSDLNKIIIKADNYYLVDIEKENEIDILDLPNDILKISTHPKERENLIFLKENNIYLYDFEEKTISIFLENVIDYSLKNGFSWISDEGFLLENIENPEKINRTPIEIDEEKEYEIMNFNDKIIRINDDYYLLDQETLSFKHIFKSSETPVASPDSKKIAYSDGYEIKVLFLEGTDDHPQRNRLDNIFLTRFSNKLENINWYTSHYLIFNIFDDIKIIEIDNRNNINIVDLAQFKEPKIHFNFPSKKLYVLSEDNLFSSRQLIP